LKFRHLVYLTQKKKSINFSRITKHNQTTDSLDNVRITLLQKIPIFELPNFLAIFAI